MQSKDEDLSLDSIPNQAKNFAQSHYESTPRSSAPVAVEKSRAFIFELSPHQPTANASSADKLPPSSSMLSTTSTSEMSIASHDSFSDLDLVTPKTPYRAPLQEQPTPELQRISEQQRINEQQRIIAHESRNIRHSAISNLAHSQIDLRDAIAMIHTLIINTPQDLPTQATLKNVLSKLGFAYESQQLALSCERYVDVINNYLLSPTFQEQFVINACLHELLDMFIYECEEKGIALIKMGHLLDETDYLVVGQKAAILYPMVNVLKNAIKFVVAANTAHQITVSLNVEATRCTISISDTGMGMTPEQVNHCFDGVDKKYHASIQGNGSGLSHIKKSLCDAQGDITVESQVGIGTTFNITMPLTLIQKKENKLDYSITRVLAVDDNFLNLRVLSRILCAIGLKKTKLTTASSKEEALQLFIDKATSEQAFSVVLTDMNMPAGTDGLELINNIRAYERQKHLKQRSKIVILSADAPSDCVEDRDPRFSLADQTLPKPYIKEMIRSTLAPFIEDINRNFFFTALSSHFGKKTPIPSIIQEYCTANAHETPNSVGRSPFRLFSGKRRLSNTPTNEAAASPFSLSPSLSSINE